MQKAYPKIIFSFFFIYLCVYLDTSTLLCIKLCKISNNKHKAMSLCARPELVEGFLRALEETLYPQFRQSLHWGPHAKNNEAWGLSSGRAQDKEIFEFSDSFKKIGVV